MANPWDRPTGNPWDKPQEAPVKPQAKNAGNIYAQEDTVYDPMTGIPLIAGGGTAETTGGVDTARKVLTNVASAPLSVAMGSARPVVGVTQALSNLMGSNKGNEMTKALMDIESGLEDENQVGKVGRYLNKGLNVAGQALPMMIGGMPTAAGKVMPSITEALSTKVLPNAQGYLGNLANRVATGFSTGGVVGATNIVDPSNPDYWGQKLKDTGLSATLGGVIPVGVDTAKMLGGLLRKGIGVETGVGEEALKTAYEAGKNKNQEFLDNLRQKVPMKDVLNTVEGNLSTMQKKLADAYRSGMADISKDRTVLSYDSIKDSIRNAAEKYESFAGKVKNKTVNEALENVRATVKDWQAEPAKIFHTPEGMDNLKQSIYGIAEKYDRGSTARNAVMDVYHSIKNTIAEQAPTYSDVMKNYHVGKEALDEIKAALSLNPNANISTTLNKLQSLMRNNVNTNYGYREQMANKLIEEGGKDFMPALAGQALSTWTPRGLTGKGLEIGAVLHPLYTGSFNPLAAGAALATTSPKLMGYTQYGLGRAAGQITPEAANLARLLTLKAAQPSQENK